MIIALRTSVGRTERRTVKDTGRTETKHYHHGLDVNLRLLKYTQFSDTVTVANAIQSLSSKTSVESIAELCQILEKPLYSGLCYTFTLNKVPLRTCSMSSMTSFLRQSCTILVYRNRNETRISLSVCVTREDSSVRYVHTN